VTLRGRLLLVLVGVVAAGLILSDVVTYTQLRSFLVARVDPQLQVASFSMTRALEAENGLAPALPFVPAPTTPGTFSGGSSSRLPGGSATGGLPRGFGGGHSGSGLEPAGTFGELVNAHGVVVGKTVSVIYTGKAVARPVLPHPLPALGRNGTAVFSATSKGGTVSYRVLVRSFHYRDLTVVVAIPLTDVNQTLGRLLQVELLVSAAVLLGLGVLAWWIVRRGLRPLEQMAETAGEIAGGDLGRRVTPAEDRTEVGRLGLALNAMLGEIEDAFADRAASEGRLRRFLADASHELRTPLTSIRGYAEIFDLGASERPADLATSMHHIREEADRMNVLVDDLLLLARLDQERPLDIARVNLVAVVAKSVDAARLFSPGQQVELLAPEVVEVFCDAHRVRQVVDNLVGNAVRHSPPGGPVVVRVLVEQDGAAVEVSDRGPGVAPADAERIFEPFFRADTSRARATGGAGLGLAIVAAIARAHGGTVGVRSNGPGGATFWIRLPFGSPSADPQEAESLRTETVG